MFFIQLNFKLRENFSEANYAKKDYKASSVQSAKWISDDHLNYSEFAGWSFKS